MKTYVAAAKHAVTKIPRTRRAILRRLREVKTWHMRRIPRGVFGCEPEAEGRGSYPKEENRAR